MLSYYCYQCSQTCSVQDTVERCPNCNSDFIEVLQIQQQQQQIQEQQQLQVRNQQQRSTRTYTAPDGQLFVTVISGDNFQNRFNNSLQQQVQALFSGFRDNQNIDHFISQILEQHEPHRTPADEVFIQNIPYLKVQSSTKAPQQPQDSATTRPDIDSQLISSIKGSTYSQQDCTNYYNFLKSSNSNSNSSGTVRDRHSSVYESEKLAQCSVGDKCSVCWEEFVKDIHVLELPCGHDFHKECLLPWLEKQNTCPVCRATYPMKNDSSQRRNGNNDSNNNHNNDNRNNESSGEDTYFSDEDASENYSTAESSQSSRGDTQNTNNSNFNCNSIVNYSSNVNYNSNIKFSDHIYNNYINSSINNESRHNNNNYHHHHNNKNYDHSNKNSYNNIYSKRIKYSDKNNNKEVCNIGQNTSSNIFENSINNSTLVHVYRQLGEQQAQKSTKLTSNGKQVSGQVIHE